MADIEKVQSIDLPVDIFSRVESRLPYTEFDSVENYIEFVLKEVLKEVNETSDGEDAGVDEAQVQERLKSLGYLND